MLSTILAAGLLGLPQPMDGLLRWDVKPGQAEAAMVESGGEGLIHSNRWQVWMDFRFEREGTIATLTWSHRENLVWVEVIRDYPTKAAALAELNRWRDRYPPATSEHEDSSGVVFQWTDGVRHHVMWVAASETTPGAWSLGRNWQQPH